MKKIILTVAAVMVMTMGYAKTQKTTAVRNVENYSFTFNLRGLAVTLGLTDYQMEAVKVINDNLNEDLASAATAGRHERHKLFREAFRKDARYMRYVLDDKQYDTYMKLVEITLQNKFGR